MLNTDIDRFTKRWYSKMVWMSWISVMRKCNSTIQSEEHKRYCTSYSLSSYDSRRKFCSNKRFWRHVDRIL